jgi:HSP20 family molecular chaperone IbpA
MLSMLVCVHPLTPTILLWLIAEIGRSPGKPDFFITSILDNTDSREHRMDLHENAETKTVTATFELPGLKQQDVNVEVHGNRLSISGESKRSENFDKGGYVVQERSYGKFSRTLQIPQGIRVSVLTAWILCRDSLMI